MTRKINNLEDIHCVRDAGVAGSPVHSSGAFITLRCASAKEQLEIPLTN